MESKKSLIIRAVSGDEEGKKLVEKVEVTGASSPDTLRYIQKKLRDKGIQRMDRHPVHGFGLAHGLPKSGHGGKFTWEGPLDVAEAESDPVPPAIDHRDPNYVDDDADADADADADVDADERETSNEGDGLIIGEVEVAKVEEPTQGVSRLEIRPPLQL